MFWLVLISLLIIEAALLTKYLRALTDISTIDINQQKLLGLTVLGGSLTNYILLKDVKFFICLLTKSYAKSKADEHLKYQLDKARSYLLLQYPIVILLFFVPTFFSLK